MFSVVHLVCSVFVAFVVCVHAGWCFEKFVVFRLRLLNVCCVLCAGFSWVLGLGSLVCEGSL